MLENATEIPNSTQAAQIEELDQEIAAKKARIAEQNSLLRSAQLHFRAYSKANQYANEERQRRQDLWARIVEQPHHKFFDSGQLPGDSGTIVDLVPDAKDESKTIFICYEPPEKEGDQAQIGYTEILTDSGDTYLPQQVDPNLLRSIRMPLEAEPYESLADLITKISQLILRCVAITNTDARL